MCSVSLLDAIAAKNGDLGAAVAELCSRAARLDQRDADTKLRYFLGHSLAEALNAKLGGMVHGVGRISNLPAISGHLDNPSAALCLQMRQAVPNQHNGAGEVV